MARQAILVAALVLLPLRGAPAEPSASILISPETTYLSFDSGPGGAVRHASTPVRVVVVGWNALEPHRWSLYACMDQDAAMTAAQRSSTLASADLRIQNAQGEWSELEPLPELGGRRGVLIAFVNSRSARVLLQVQLRVPAGQRPGAYQGMLTLLALEE